MKLFLDTEFSSLNVSESRLISIALVSEDDRFFYAELPANGYLKACSDFVKKSVLPLLMNGENEMNPFTLVLRLRDWLAQFDSAEIVTDAPSWDFPFLRTAIDEESHGWPANLATGAVLFTPAEAWMMAYFKIPGHNQHNALHDARALKAAWVERSRLSKNTQDELT